MTHVLRVLAAVAAFGSIAAPVSAQIDPADNGSGTRLGIEALNGSGQVGDVTLFDSGAETRVAIHVDGARGHKNSLASLAARPATRST